MSANKHCFAIVGHDHTCMADISMLLWPDFGPSGPIITLADVATRFATWHSRMCHCGVDLHLEDNIWEANLSRELVLEDDALLEDYYPEESQRVSPQTLLTDICRADNSMEGSITAFFGLDPGLDVRRAQFTGVRSLYGDVCRVSYDPFPSLPGPEVTDYRQIVSTAGICFVFKAKILDSWYMRNQLAPIAIIRRPPGYGKTTFVSMCCTLFGDCPRPALFPLFGGCDTWDSRPVLRLDFSELDLASCPSEDMAATADSFMERAAQTLWDRYLPNETYSPNELYDSPHLKIKALSTRYCQQLFLAIDNYTHPFLTAPTHICNLIEHVIWHRVLAPMLDSDGDASGIIIRGIITGTQSHGVAPFASFPAFARATRDLTYSAEHAAVIGFTPADVRGLARAVLRGDPGPECEQQFLAACCLPAAGDVVLCAGDVLRLLRLYKAGQPPRPGPAPYRFAAGQYMDPVEFDGPDDYAPGMIAASSSEDSGLGGPQTPPPPSHSGLLDGAVVQDAASDASGLRDDQIIASPPPHHEFSEKKSEQ